MIFFFSIFGIKNNYLSTISSVEKPTTSLDQPMDPLERLVDKSTTSLEKTWDKPSGDDKIFDETPHLCDKRCDHDNDEDNNKLFDVAFGFTQRISPTSNSSGIPGLQYVSEVQSEDIVRKRREVCQLIESNSNRSLASELLRLGPKKPPTESIEFCDVLDDDLLHVLKNIGEIGRREIIGDTLHVSPRKARLAMLKAPSPIEMYLMLQGLSASGTSFQPLTRWNKL